MITKEFETKPIIQSLLWTDQYKISMGQAVFHHYPDIDARYGLINRGRHQFPEGFGRKLTEQVEMMADLTLTESDRRFLEAKAPYLQSDFLDFLGNYHFDPKEVQIKQDGTSLNVEIEGPWKRTIHWEVTLMALICELYYQETGQSPDADYIDKAREKGKAFREAKALLLEFGTRRAFSHKVHRDVLEALLETAGQVEEGGILLGTSNVALAKEFNLNPSGTFAHEWVMAHAALFGYADANEKALEIWAKEYLGLDGGVAYPKLGTALTDTFTTNVFLRTFSEKWAKLFTFTRQDSGDPFEQGRKLLKAWQEAIGNPLEQGKGTVFSDSLDTKTALKLDRFFRTQEIVAAGIGTHLTNDTGPDPMNFVIKSNAFTSHEGLWIPVCKLSDVTGKESGDSEAIRKAKEELGL